LLCSFSISLFLAASSFSSSLTVFLSSASSSALSSFHAAPLFLAFLKALRAAR